MIKIFRLQENLLVFTCGYYIFAQLSYVIYHYYHFIVISLIVKKKENFPRCKDGSGNCQVTKVQIRHIYR